MFSQFLNADSSIWLLIGGVIVGFILIIFGGDKFVDSAIWMAVKTKIPQMIIGATIVSIGTTLPELFTSFTAAAAGEVAISVGNAFGSILCNTALILAISLIASPTDVNRRQFTPKYIILAVSVLLLLFFSLNGTVAIWQSIIMVAIFLGYMAYNIISAAKQMKLVKADLGEECEQSADNELAKYHDKKAWVMITLFVVGAVAIAAGANFLVDSVSGLCAKYGVPTDVIALTVVAFGTSLPELVTALTSLKKNSTEISLGNILGANVLNATIITGGSGIIGGGLIITDVVTMVVTCILIIAVLVVLGVPILLKKRTFRYQGITMMACYLAYLGFLIQQLFTRG
jgi:cation:H+ antiporter